MYTMKIIYTTQVLCGTCKTTRIYGIAFNHAVAKVSMQSAYSVIMIIWLTNYWPVCVSY